uniref:Uncharacterized protein n=1 Tax=Solanum lycopersicum TaxID=4081 RepID=A0A3Q7G968_SOLLC
MSETPNLPRRDGDDMLSQHTSKSREEASREKDNWLRLGNCGIAFKRPPYSPPKRSDDAEERSRKLNPALTTQL